MKIDQVMIKRIDNGFNVVTPRNIDPPENVRLLNPQQAAQAQQAYLQAQQAAAQDPLIHFCEDVEAVKEYLTQILVIGE